MADAVLALDQGTTSSRAIVFDDQGRAVATAQQDFQQYFPNDGWVEHDLEEIWQTQLAVGQSAYDQAAAKGYRIRTIGVTNQRETSAVWDRQSGKPIARAIVWQDRRTADLCARLRDNGVEAMIRERTGLLLDPYFSASKIAWLLDHIPDARDHARSGQLAFGTIDSFLLSRLTGRHASDVTNASRTSLYNIRKLDWDDDLCRVFNVPRRILPEVLPTVADYGECRAFGSESIPVQAMIGDQQAASIGQGCFAPGMIKATFGTGCFALMNTGNKIAESSDKLLTTIAFGIDGKICYALEGSIFMAGAVVQWLRDGLGVIDDAAQSADYAAQSREEIYFVPAFTGLGAPWWDPAARGAIYGLNRAVTAKDLVRAGLDSIAFQAADLIAIFENDGGAIQELRIDGGMAANDFFVQSLADIIGRPVLRPRGLEATALGAAWCAGHGIDLYGGVEDFARIWTLERRFSPLMEKDERARRIDRWHDAVDRTRSKRS